MDNQTIDFLVNGIDARQEATRAALEEMRGTPDDLNKINRLLELLGEASEELAHVRWEMHKNKKPIRKFAILKKSA